MILFLFLLLLLPGFILYIRRNFKFWNIMQPALKLKLFDFESNVTNNLEHYYITSTVNCINISRDLNSFYSEMLTDDNFCLWLTDNPNVLDSVYNLLLLYFTYDQKYIQHIYKQI